MTALNRPQHPRSWRKGPPRGGLGRGHRKGAGAGPLALPAREGPRALAPQRFVESPRPISARGLGHHLPIGTCRAAVAGSRWGRTRVSLGTFGSFPAALRFPENRAPWAPRMASSRPEKGWGWSTEGFTALGGHPLCLGPGGWGGWT